MRLTASDCRQQIPSPAVPEPSGLALLGTDILGVVGAGRRKLFKA